MGGAQESGGNRGQTALSTRRKGGALEQEASPLQESDALGGGGGAQFQIEGGERQTTPLRQFQVSRIVQSQSVACRQPRRRAPRLPVGFGIEDDWQKSKVD